MEKISTGITGLDSMLYGGVPENKNIALCGGPGTGKTLLSFEFLVNGAKNNETGLFISLQESDESVVENIRETFTELSDDIQLMIDDKKLFVYKPKTLDINGLITYVEKQVLKNNVKRIVIDSANVLKFNFRDVYNYRITMQEFLIFLGNLECTMMLNYELPYTSREQMRYGLEQFIADGIINLYNLVRQEKRIRAMEVLKMRGTKHKKDLVPYKITNSGISVFVGEKVY